MPFRIFTYIKSNLYAKNPGIDYSATKPLDIKNIKFFIHN